MVVIKAEELANMDSPIVAGNERRKKEKEKQRKMMKKLERMIGPKWFTKLSKSQRESLNNLQDHMHKDIIEEQPKRTQMDLYTLGITPPISSKTVMEAVLLSKEDPGLFIWFLYIKFYGAKPTDIKEAYDLNQRLLMSSLYCIDINECIQELNKLCLYEKRPKDPPKPISPPNPRAISPYLEILKLRCPTVKEAPIKHKPSPLRNQFVVKTEEEFEEIRLDETFLNIRKVAKSIVTSRPVKYKFWKPPSRKGGRKNGLSRMFKRKPKIPKKLLDVPKYDLHIGGIAYVKKKPHFIINSAVPSKPIGIPIHGGMVSQNGEMVPYVVGYAEERSEKLDEGCNRNCKCLEWEEIVMKFLKQSKCICRHNYDMYHTGTPPASYFTPPKGLQPYFFNYDKLLDFNFWKDAIPIRKAKRVPIKKLTIDASKLTRDRLLQYLLAELSLGRLILPHLHMAHHLPALQEWVRHRIHGPLTTKEKQKLYTASKSYWDALEKAKLHINNLIMPFSVKEQRYMTWMERELIGQLVKILHAEYLGEYGDNVINDSRIFWATMMSQSFSSSRFSDVYFAYLPTIHRQIKAYRPYSDDMVREKIPKRS